MLAQQKGLYSIHKWKVKVMDLERDFFEHSILMKKPKVPWDLLNKAKPAETHSRRSVSFLLKLAPIVLVFVSGSASHLVGMTSRSPRGERESKEMGDAAETIA